MEYKSIKKNIAGSFLLGMILSCGTFLSQEVFGQAPDNSDKEIIKKIADNILSNTTFDFFINEKQAAVTNFIDAGFNSDALIKSPYNEWRYFNGVLNIAILRLAENYKENK